MSVDSSASGDFLGNERHQAIHNRLFGLLTEYDRIHPEGFVDSWLLDDVGWDGWMVLAAGWIFLSLARALPNDNFHYESYLDDLNVGLLRVYNTINYENGRLDLCSTSYSEVEVEEADDEEGEDPLDIDWDARTRVEEMPFSCSLNEEGIVEDQELARACLENEKKRLSWVLELMETGTEEAHELICLGILYETGLAGVDRDLRKAWDCYLKAAGSGDRLAAEFVRKIFSSECREELRSLLEDGSISKDWLPVYLDLASREKNEELMAELLEYQAAMG